MAAGYPMAQNLRSKVPEGDSMTVFDVNSKMLEQFVKEADPAKVTVAKGPREVAEKSVSSSIRRTSCDEPYSSIYENSSDCLGGLSMIHRH
jgi:hypothetical protein